ncbi:hypothetical protein F5146DRAFT_1005133 [Armillaria mellea]|nr:hypothetical protein F5146DRAFT_1005133 [Armillaria mellea]
MTEALPPPHLSDLDSGWNGDVLRSKDEDVDWCDGPCIDSGYVRGLSKGLPEGDFREGELIIKDNTGTKHTFMIVADHQYPIPEGLYALVGSNPHWLGRLNRRQYWVIGERHPGQMFKKVSVFQIPNQADIERLHELGVTTNTKTFLA